MDEKLSRRIEETAALLQRIRPDHPWQHAYLQHLAALTFAVGSRPYDPVALRALMERIRRSFGLFSPYRAASFQMAVQMLSGPEDPEAVLARLVELDPLLREERLRSYAYAPLLAMVLARAGNRGDLRRLVVATKECYREMHRSHPFLTGSDDYPLAALLVLDGHPLSERLADVEAIYSLLHLKGLSRGNGLQLASLILALGQGTPMERAERAIDLRDRIRASGIRLWPQYYGALGMLGLLPDPDGRRAGDAVEVVEAFRRLRRYRWLDKGMLLLFSSILLADEAMRDTTSTTTGVLLEMLIQAQAAAMVAVTAATTSAAASSGS